MFTQKANRLTNLALRQPLVQQLARRAPKSATVVDFVGKLQTFSPGDCIFEEGDPTDFIYKVISGTIRSYKLLDNGRRKIEAFRLAGELFGIDSTECREFTTEAVDNVTAAVVQRSVMFKGPAIANHDFEGIWMATAHELSRVQQHALLLGKNGQQRLACFLLDMSRRLKQPDVLELPMPRQDIADYLGLTIETVSRMMTQLQASDTIALVTSRRVLLRNREALERLSMEQTAGAHPSHQCAPAPMSSCC
jgi:CRP/FNR family nitrogen fixation transcriptional regulator